MLWIRTGFIRNSPIWRFAQIWGILFYPAAHYVICKAIGAAYDRTEYFEYVAPAQFAIQFIAATAVFAWICTKTKRPDFGVLKLDWSIAGIAVPILWFAQAQGLYFIRAAAGDSPHRVEFSASDILLSAITVIVLYSFSLARSEV